MDPGDRSSLSSERRRTLRYPFVASGEVVEISSGVRLDTRVSERMLPPHDRSDTQRNVSVGQDLYRDRFLQARANVVYWQTNLGVGLAFRDVRTRFSPVLEKWLQSAVRGELQGRAMKSRTTGITPYVRVFLICAGFCRFPDRSCHLGQAAACWPAPLPP
jgi:hypothetical protein